MIATTRAALLRGTPDTDALGDEIDYDGPEVGHYETVPTTYTPWVEQRRNPLLDPRQLGNTAAGEAQIRYAWLRTFPSGDGPPGFDTYVRHTAAGTQNGTFRGIDVLANADTSSPGTAGAWMRAPYPAEQTQLTFSCWVRTNAARFFSIGGRRHTGLGTWVAPYSVGSTIALEANVWTRVVRTFDLGDGAGYMVFRVGFPGSAPYTAGATLDLTASMIGVGTDESYLDGDLPSFELLRRRYEGERGFSASVEEVRAVDVPEHQIYVVDKPSAYVQIAGREDFPISIIEKDTREQDPASGTWRTIQKLIGRAAINVPVDVGDRIKDLRDGGIYAVDHVKRTPRGLSGRGSVTMKLRRTNP